MGAEALYATRQGVDTAGHNIANAQVEGYSRQKVLISQRHPSEKRGNIIGNGTYVKNITRAHNSFIEKQLNNAIQVNGYSAGRFDSLTGVEAIYSTEMAASVSDELTRFFNAWQTLAATPDEQPMRSNLRETAQDLVNAFRRVDSNLEKNQSDINQNLRGVVDQLNGELKQIAELNVSIGALEAGEGLSANDLRDQRDALVRSVSDKLNVNYYYNQQGLVTLRGPGQILLVDGKYHGKVSTTLNTKTGMDNIIAFDHEGGNMRRIDHIVESGKLKGFIDVRDHIVPELKMKNNHLAHQVAENVNKIHREGYGLGEYGEFKNRDFFYVPDEAKHTAGSIRLSNHVTETTNAISAAATPNAVGDNIIVNRIVRLRNAQLMDDGQNTFNQYYSNYVGLLGVEMERTVHQKEADAVILGEVSSRRESVSGVSLDEEAVNLLRWQTAFAASSKVITTTDEMLETLLSLKR